jgi:hypothetical protein
VHFFSLEQEQDASHFRNTISTEESHMGNAMRLRGRPRGSGKNDAPYLAKVAELLIGDPSLKPTSAMKRVIRCRTDWDANDPTLLRRWQVKWKANGPSHLCTAQKRVHCQHRAASVRSSELLWMQAAKDFENSPWMRAIRDMENLPIMRVIKDMESSPWLRGTINSPGFQKLIDNARAVQCQNELARLVSPLDFKSLVGEVTM